MNQHSKSKPLFLLIYSTTTHPTLNVACTGVYTLESWVFPTTDGKIAFYKNLIHAWDKIIGAITLDSFLLSGFTLQGANRFYGQKVILIRHTKHFFYNLFERNALLQDIVGSSL